MSFLTTTFFENEVWKWFLCLGIVVFVWVAMRVALRMLTGRLKVYAARTPGQFDDLVVEVLQKTKFFFVLIASLYAGSLALALPVKADDYLQIAFLVVLLVQAGYWGSGLVTLWINRSVRRKLGEDAGAGAATSLAALGFIAKLTLWAVVVLLGLANMGIDITALVAGMGIGGIALALAVQSILSDLFASLSIIVDKPFVIGDFIVIGDLKGSVERIGLKTTRVRSLTGEQIIFSNSDLLSSRVRNYKRMYERRIDFTIGVTYDTPTDLLERISGMIRAIIEAQPNARFDRSHFKAFGDFSLNFETVYFVLVPDYATYMDTQQAINLTLMRRFEEEGIEFAYPTQTLYVNRPSQDEQPNDQRDDDADDRRDG